MSIKTIAIPAKWNNNISSEKIIDLDCPINSIYELKSVLSTKLLIDIDSLFLYDGLDNGSLYQNNDDVRDITVVYYRRLGNACNVCAKKSVMITGDCNYCKCKYCNVHRLPESHSCPRLNDCRKTQFNINHEKVMNGKCVSSIL
jgi:hypothetical protein